MKKWFSVLGIFALGLSGALVIAQGLEERTGIVQVGHIQLESASMINPSSIEEALAGDGGRAQRYARIFSLSDVQITNEDVPTLQGVLTIPVSAPAEGLLEIVITAPNEAIAGEIFRVVVANIQERLNELESNFPESLQMTATRTELGPVQESYSSRNTRLLAGTVLVAGAMGIALAMLIGARYRRD